MNKPELVTNFREKLRENDIRIQRDVAEEIYETLIETLAEALVAGHDVKIANFGTFKISKRKYRFGVDKPEQTGVQIKFVVSSGLKEQIIENL